MLKVLQEDFKGKLIHTTQYKTPKEHEGKKVVVIGACTSGPKNRVSLFHSVLIIDQGMMSHWIMENAVLVCNPSFYRAIDDEKSMI